MSFLSDFGAIFREVNDIVGEVKQTASDGVADVMSTVTDANDGIQSIKEDLVRSGSDIMTGAADLKSDVIDQTRTSIDSVFKPQE